MAPLTQASFGQLRNAKSAHTKAALLRPLRRLHSAHPLNINEVLSRAAFPLQLAA